MKRVWTATALGLFLLLSGCSKESTGPPEFPTPIMTVAQPIRKQVVEWDAYTGRLDAINFVEVRARVGGFLQSIHFVEGQIVQAGDLLAVIDPRPFEAELASALATLDQAISGVEEAKAQLKVSTARQLQSQAQFDLAKLREERARTLGVQQAISEEEVDQRVSELAQARADLDSSAAVIVSSTAAISTAKAKVELAKAGVQAAELNLNYTELRAPVTGRISSKHVTEGNLVSGGTATSTLLTTIASVQPIYCNFDANEQEVLKYSRLALSGQRKSSRDVKNPVFLGLNDETGFPHQGHMDFVDNRFDPGTASMRARAIFANEDQLLLPGMFARIRLPGSATAMTTLVPDSSIGTDQASRFVYIVVDGKIERRSVTLGSLVDGLRVVYSGLEGNESLVIEGLLQARPGMAVETKPGKIDAIEDGLPDTYKAVPESEWIVPVTASKPVNGHAVHPAQAAPVEGSSPSTPRATIQPAVTTSPSVGSSEQSTPESTVPNTDPASAPGESQR